jgi:hypothetical protein
MLMYAYFGVPHFLRHVFPLTGVLQLIVESGVEFYLVERKLDADGGLMIEEQVVGSNMVTMIFLLCYLLITDDQGSMSHDPAHQVVDAPPR